jgi:anti-sigma regulatory factor (Ser/Thr protein kinase)
MTTRLAPPAAERARGDGGYAVVRCLSGPRPEHRARRLVTDVLAAAGVEAELDDVELAVNELITNARQHAPGPYELRIVFGPTSVMVAVVDGGADHAELARRFLNAAAGGVADGESGRGLQIVAGLFPGLVRDRADVDVHRAYSGQTGVDHHRLPCAHRAGSRRGG